MSKHLVGHLQVRSVSGVEFPIFREVIEGTEELWTASPEVIGKAIADVVSKYLNAGFWGKHLRVVTLRVQKPVLIEYVLVRRINQGGSDGSHD